MDKYIVCIHDNYCISHKNLRKILLYFSEYNRTNIFSIWDAFSGKIERLVFVLDKQRDTILMINSKLSSMRGLQKYWSF